jgi:hypothetical protein
MQLEHLLLKSTMWENLLRVLAAVGTVNVFFVLVEFPEGRILSVDDPQS